MPHFDAERKLSLDMVHELGQTLSGFCIDTEARLDDDSLSHYFDTYGFTKMSCGSKSKYSLGFLDIKSFRVVAHCWVPQKCTATVFVAHGLFDHVGLYLDLVDTLLAKGFMVVAIDFPGHGLSDGEPAVIADFSDYGSVIEHSLTALEKDLYGPVYAVGQSTGGAALLNYVLDRRGLKFSKLVLLAPLIKPRGWRRIYISHLLLHRFLRFVPRRFKLNSNRKNFNEFLEKYDPLQPRHISVEWIGAMKKWVKRFSTYAVSDVDILIYQGDSDDTVLWEKNIPLIQSKFERSEVKMIKGAMHHLVNEDDAWRGPMFEGIVNFLNADS